MPDLKETLILEDGFTLVPKDSYIRLAKVLTVSLMSKKMTVQFLDGDKDDDGVFLDAPVEVESVIGSDDPSTTYVPSATVYGRDDLCARRI